MININQYFENQKSVIATYINNEDSNKHIVNKIKDVLLSIIEVLAKIKTIKYMLPPYIVDNDTQALIAFINKIANNDLLFMLPHIITKICVTYNIPFDINNGNATIDAIYNYIDIYKNDKNKNILRCKYTKQEVKKIFKDYISN